MTNPHRGPTLEEFLKEEGLYEDAVEFATRRVVAWQLEQARKDSNISKTEMARRMETSRSQLDRILNGDESDIGIKTLERGAAAVGKRLKVELV